MKKKKYYKPIFDYFYGLPQKKNQVQKKENTTNSIRTVTYHINTRQK